VIGQRYSIVGLRLKQALGKTTDVQMTCSFLVDKSKSQRTKLYCRFVNFPRLSTGYLDHGFGEL
jgi:hypothetical protein